MDVIQGDNLSKKFRAVRALEQISFTITDNKITGLIGRNGAGKTTLLRLIAGHIRPSGGEIRVLGRKPFNNLEVSASTIFVDERMAFPTAFTLTDILAAMPAFYRQWDRKIATGLFEYFGLNPRQHHHHLSKGTQSLFNCIVGISAHCPVTIFDEPTAGMDSAFRKDFYRALLKDYIQFPRTIILSSHLLNEVEDLLEDILLIDRGQVRLHLPVSDFKEWALGFRGQAEIVAGLTEGKEILYREDFGKDGAYAVVKRSEMADRLERARGEGIEITPVATDDLCVYLTAKTRGGIDDVFKKA